jgi:uncharacterized protein YjbJ (UPF0337 family)
MNWDRIEGNWMQFTGKVNERWDNLTDRQLASRVQETYGMTNGEGDAQLDLTDWQQRLSEIEGAKR